MPLINEGDALFHIACFEEDDKAVAASVESFDEFVDGTLEEVLES